MVEIIIFTIAVPLLFCSLGYAVYSISQILEKVNILGEKYEENL